MYPNTSKVIHTCDMIMAPLEISCNSLNEYVNGNNDIHLTSSQQSGISSSNSDDIIRNVENTKDNTNIHEVW